MLGKRRKTMDDCPSQRVGDRPIQDTPIHPVERTRYEVDVETGLDTIKRIKLFFHDSSTDTFPPGTSGSPDKPTNPVDVDCIPQGESKKLDTAQADVSRVTPPAAIEPGRSLPDCSRLILGRREHSPTTYIRGEDL